MTVDRGELHELVEELPDDQVADVIADVRRRVRRPRGVSSRPFAWIAMGPANNGRADNAERVDDLLADGFGRS